MADYILKLLNTLVENLRKTINNIYSQLFADTFKSFLIIGFSGFFSALIFIDGFFTFKSVGYLTNWDFSYRVFAALTVVGLFNILPLGISILRKQRMIFLLYVCQIMYVIIMLINMLSNITGFGGNTVVESGCKDIFDYNNKEVANYCNENRLRHKFLKDSMVSLKSYEVFFNKGQGPFYKKLDKLEESIKKDDLYCSIDRSWPNPALSEARGTCYVLGDKNFWNSHLNGISTLIEKVKTYDTRSICNNMMVLYNKKMGNDQISGSIPDFCKNESEWKEPEIKNDVSGLWGLVQINTATIFNFMLGFLSAFLLLLVEMLMNIFALNKFYTTKKEYNDLEKKLRKMYSIGSLTNDDVRRYHEFFNKTEMFLSDLEKEKDNIYDILDLFRGSGNAIKTDNIVPRRILKMFNMSKSYIWVDPEKKIFLLEILSDLTKVAENKINKKENSDRNSKLNSINKVFVITDGSTHDFVAAKGNCLLESREIKITPLSDVYKEGRKSLPDAYHCKKQISEVAKVLEKETGDLQIMIGGMIGKLGFSWYLSQQEFSNRINVLRYTIRTNQKQVEILLNRKRTFSGNDLSEYKEIFLPKKENNGVLLGIYLHNHHSKKEFKNNLQTYAKKNGLKMEYFCKDIKEDELPELLSFISDRTINTINSICDSAGGQKVYVAIMSYWPVTYVVGSALKNKKTTLLQWDGNSHKPLSI